MDSMKQIILQEMNEEHFNRKHIDVKIRAAIEANPTMVERVEMGVQLVNEMLGSEHYITKQARLKQLQGLDITALVMDLFVGIAYCQTPELFTSVSAQLASRLKFSEKAEAISTVADLLAVLCQTDAFDITKANKNASLMVVSKIPLADNLITFIEGSQILPPMVCTPLKLTHNYSSGYLTHNDSLLLGSGNHHDGDLCLDVLNTMNQVALKLDTDFLSKVEHEPTYELHTQQQKDDWLQYRKVGYRFFSLMTQQGNRFHFTHKVDKRGRIYSMGYHINPQGTAFQKAMLELADEEIVEGVPT